MRRTTRIRITWHSLLGQRGDSILFHSLDCTSALYHIQDCTSFLYQRTSVPITLYHILYHINLYHIIPGYIVEV